MKTSEIYNNTVIYNFFNIIKFFNPDWANINKIFYININKFIVNYEPTIYNIINLYRNYLQMF